MPVVQTPGVGQTLAASATTAMRRDILLDVDAIFSPAGTAADPWLAVPYMPGIRLWILQTDAIASPATVQVQGSFRPADLGGGGDEVINLTAPFVLVPLVPAIIPVSIAVGKVRLSLTRVAGVATNIQYALAGIAGG